MRLQVLVPIHTYPEGNAEGIAAHAAAVASHLEADIHALVLNAEFPPVSSALGNLLINVPALVKEVKERCHARGAALVKVLETEMQSRGIVLQTKQTGCFPEAFGEAVAAHARYHDIAVVGLGSSDAGPPATAQAAIFGSGRPTLLVPEQLAPARFQHMMIAWDGSRVAARAVADARDFLRRAETITIASVVDEKRLPEDDPGNRLAHYLSKHDRTATVIQLEGGNRPIARTLQDHAAEIGADMLVMGGFGHSRMRDFVLGGATSGIIQDLRIAALVSH